MRHLAIVGSGPAGFYTAEAALKVWGPGVAIDIIDRLPVPYGLIRGGVAPDHQAIKAVVWRYEAVSLSENVRFLGNVGVGSDVTIPELRGLYDAVVLATGAPRDKPLDLAGTGLANVFGSAAFVGWYNGHPQFSELNPDVSGKRAVVIGNGNVALDVARILAKTPGEFAGSDIVAHALEVLGHSRISDITILGRRGPYQIGMSGKELSELADLERAAPHVEAGELPPPAEDAALDANLRQALRLLRRFTQTQPRKPITIRFAFFTAPRALLGEGRVQAVAMERTRLEGGKAVGTGEFHTIPADLVISCIGYQTSPIPDVPFDEQAGRFASVDGRIGDGLYCVGWARRGPSGTIGSNRPDGYAIVEAIAQDQPKASAKAGGIGLDALVQARGLKVTSFNDWKRIEEAEAKAAREGAPREKFTDVERMIAAAEG